MRKQYVDRYYSTTSSTSLDWKRARKSSILSYQYHIIFHNYWSYCIDIVILAAITDDNDDGDNTGGKIG